MPCITRDFDFNVYGKEEVNENHAIHFALSDTPHSFALLNSKGADNGSIRKPEH